MQHTTINTPTTRCRAGVGIADITPPVGIYHRFWGAASHDQATGVHQPLRASALVLEPASAPDASLRQILIALDHCLFRPPEMTEFRDSLVRRLGVSDEQVTIVFSHTHSAAFVARDRAHLPGGDLIGPYLDSLPERVATAVQAAIATLAEVTLTYGAADCQMAHHRDAWDAENGLFVCGFNPDVELALPAKTIRVLNASSRPLATIVNYPCHPTTLAWENTLISPDYVGQLRLEVEAATGAPCLFLLAPSGNLGPRHGFVGDTSVAEKNGRQVALAALQAVESLPPTGHDFAYAGPVISGATLGKWQFVDQSEDRVAATRRFEAESFDIPLDYLPGLPTLAESKAAMAQLDADEQRARAAGDDSEARRLRALVERRRREQERLRSLPPGRFPYPVRLWRLGDAIWIAIDGEPYFELQSELERRFPHLTLILLPLSDGARAGYLPTRDSFGKPIYQSEISVLAPGCLEAVIDGIAARL